MKQKALADKYLPRNVDKNTLSMILKDMSTGVTEEVIVYKYKLKKTQFREIRTYFKEITGPSSVKKSAVKEKGISLDKFKRKSGARKQGMNETCLCGSGRKYKSCCALK